MNSERTKLPISIKEGVHDGLYNLVQSLDGKITSSLRGILSYSTKKGGGKQLRVDEIDGALYRVSYFLSLLESANVEVPHLIDSEEYEKESALYHSMLNTLSTASWLVSRIKTAKDSNAVNPWGSALPPHIAKIKGLRKKVYDAVKPIEKSYHRWKVKNREAVERYNSQIEELNSYVKNVISENDRLERAYASIDKELKNWKGASLLDCAIEILGCGGFSCVADRLHKLETDTRDTLYLKVHPKLNGLEQSIKKEMEGRPDGRSQLSYENIEGLLSNYRGMRVSLEQFKGVSDETKTMFDRGITLKSETKSHLVEALNLIIHLERLMDVYNAHVRDINHVKHDLDRNSFGAPPTINSAQADKEIRKLTGGHLKSLKEHYAAVYDEHIARIDSYKEDAVKAAESITQAYVNACSRLREQAESYKKIEIRTKYELAEVKQQVFNFIEKIGQARKYSIKGVVDKPEEVVSDSEYKELKEFYKTLCGVEDILRNKLSDSPKVINKKIELKRALEGAEMNQRRYGSYDIDYRECVIVANRAYNELLQIEEDARQSINPISVDQRIKPLFEDMAQKTKIKFEPSVLATLDNYKKEVNQHWRCFPELNRLYLKPPL